MQLPTPVMTKPAYFALVVLAALVVPLQGAKAQPPIEFRNTTEAVKLYEAGMLDTLRERCPVVKSDTLLSRPEPLSLLNGYTFVAEAQATVGRYSMFVYDQDKRSFFLVDGQNLTRDGRLTVPLALPRDYARCRIVRSSTGLEQLEVVHIEKNYPTDLLAMQRLVDDAKELGAELVAASRAAPGSSCDSTAYPGAPLDQLKANGISLPLSGCHPAALSLRDRMTRLLRKVYER